MFHYFDGYCSSNESFMPSDHLNHSFCQQSVYCYTGTIDVVAYYTLFDEKEYYPAIPAQFNQYGDLNLTALVEYLKLEGFPISKRSKIYYYSKSKDTFFYCGEDPLEHEAFVPITELDFDLEGGQRIIKIKVRNQASSVPSKTGQSTEKDEDNNTNNEDTRYKKSKKTWRKINWRSIGTCSNLEGLSQRFHGPRNKHIYQVNTK